LKTQLGHFEQELDEVKQEAKAVPRKELSAKKEVSAQAPTAAIDDERLDEIFN